MPTLPITAVYVLQNPNLPAYVIFQFADGTRSKPEEMSYYDEDMGQFNDAERAAMEIAAQYPNMWFEVK